MDFEHVKISKPMMESIRAVIKQSKLFKDETDFVEQAIIKQMSKLRDL